MKKGDPASDPIVSNHITDENKRKVTDNSKGDFQQKLLSNRTLPIITTKIDPRIDDRIATSGASPHKLVTSQTTEVITDEALSSARILYTPRGVRRTDRDGTTPGDCKIAVRSLRAYSPVMIGGIGVPPTRGHSGSFEVLNKWQSTVSEKLGIPKILMLALIESWPMMGILCPFSAM